MYMSVFWNYSNTERKMFEFKLKAMKIFKTKVNSTRMIAKKISLKRSQKPN